MVLVLFQQNDQYFIVDAGMLAEYSRKAEIVGVASVRHKQTWWTWLSQQRCCRLSSTVNWLSDAVRVAGCQVTFPNKFLLSHWLLIALAVFCMNPRTKSNCTDNNTDDGIRFAKLGKSVLTQWLCSVGMIRRDHTLLWVYHPIVECFAAQVCHHSTVQVGNNINTVPKNERFWTRMLLCA